MVTQGSGDQREPGAPVATSIWSLAVYMILQVDETEHDDRIHLPSAPRAEATD